MSNRLVFLFCGARVHHSATDTALGGILRFLAPRPHGALGIQPLDALSILPETELAPSFRVGEPGLSVLLAVDPLAFVCLAIWPVVGAEPMLLVVLVFTFIFPSVRPGVNAFSVQFVFFPLSVVDPAVGPSVLTFSFDVVVDPVTGVHRLVGPLVRALTPLLSIFEHSVILGPILELLFSWAVLHVISPEALVSLAVLVNIYSEAIGSILIKFTCIHITISVMEIALTFGHTISPIPFILSTVLPYLSALTMFDIHFLIGFIFHFFHLSCVRCAFANFEICFVNYFLFIDLLDLVSEGRLVNCTVLIFSYTGTVSILFSVINFVVAWLSFGWLTTTLISHDFCLGFIGKD